jgi:hypothetical protein
LIRSAASVPLSRSARTLDGPPTSESERTTSKLYGIACPDGRGSVVTRAGDVGSRRVRPAASGRSVAIAIPTRVHNTIEPLERLREGQRFAAPASAGAEHAALRAAWSQLARRLQLGRATHVFSDFRDGLIGKDRTFLSWDATLKAVGLSE